MISSGTEAPRLNPVNLGTLPEKNEMIRMLSIAADLFMGTFAAGNWQKKDYDEQDRLEAVCKDWLKTNFPDWKNPLAHW